MTPHLCPKCNGERTVALQCSLSITGAIGGTRPCPTCVGEGVLWEPNAHGVSRVMPRFDSPKDWIGAPSLPPVLVQGTPTPGETGVHVVMCGADGAYFQNGRAIDDYMAAQGTGIRDCLRFAYPGEPE